MNMQQLTKPQRLNTYKNHLSTDFHADEVKSHELIETLLTKGQYLCYGFFEEEQQTGYAYFIKTTDGAVIMLDYLVVFEEYRCKGYGSLFLKMIEEKLSQEFDYLLAEVENPEFASSKEDKEIRTRRIAFYQKNTFNISKVLSQVIADHYHIMYLSLKQTPSENTIPEVLIKIYQSVFGQDFVEKNIKVENRKQI